MVTWVCTDAQELFIAYGVRRHSVAIIWYCTIGDILTPDGIIHTVITWKEYQFAVKWISGAVIPYILRRYLLDYRTLSGTCSEDGVVWAAFLAVAQGLSVGREGNILNITRKSTLLRAALGVQLSNKNVLLWITLTEISQSLTVFCNGKKRVGPPGQALVGPGDVRVDELFNALIGDPDKVNSAFFRYKDLWCIDLVVIRSRLW